MSPEFDKIIRSALKELEPTSSERRRVERTFALIRTRILSKAAQLGIELEVVEVGSVGKNTWIRGEADLDVFIVFPEGTKSADVEKYGLMLGKFAAKGKYIISYAEHPYTRARVNGTDVDIVPCVGVKDSAHIQTAVDRTPFHKQFVIRRLNPMLREGILLLKRFMLTVGIYGAEIKVGGFSGYLVELLVIHYNGFAETLHAAAGWQEGTVLALQRSYNRPDDARLVFEHDPLIVVDPVDRRRNVAAAVSRENMAIFVSAAREFIGAPSKLYFTYTPRAVSPASLLDAIRRQEVPLIGVQIDCPKLVPDILWGQLHKSLSGLATLLKRYGFTVVYSGVWTDETSCVVFLFELSSLELAASFVHEGPSVYMKAASERFLDTHLTSSKVSTGPWVEGDRWLVQLRRTVKEAKGLLKERFGEARLGVDIEKNLRKKKRIESYEDVTKLAGGERSFVVFLTQFLRRRPVWLEWRLNHPAKNI